MKKELLFTAKTVEQALAEAGLKLGMETEKLEYEIIEREKIGFFGIGSSPAKVKIFVEEIVASPEPETKTEAKAEPPTEPEAPAEPEVKSEPETKAEPGIKPEPEAPTEPENKAESEVKVESETKAESEVEAAAPEETEPAESESEPQTRGCGDHAAKEFIETLLADMNIDAKVEMTRVRKSDRAITVTGDAAGVLIGHHGDTLDALQYLANLAANKREEDESRDYVHITVDIENYRAKREVALRALARRVSDKVAKTGKPVMLEPMNPYERRIIHSEVQGIEGVSTNSIGEDSNRRVVIYLESAGFSVPEPPAKFERSDRRPRRSDRNDRPDRRRSDRGSRGDRPNRRSDRPAPQKSQPIYNDGEKMSSEEVNELVATYGTRETKENNKREQPAKFKSFEDYMNSILGESNEENK